MMSRWVNPPPRHREKEVFISMPAVTEKPFEFYLEQVGKKKMVKKKKSGRVAEKSVLIAERLGMQVDK